MRARIMYVRLRNGVLRAVCTAQADPAAAHIANILRSLVVVPEAVVRACVGRLGASVHT
jgi:hypothetical protein